MRYPSLVRYKGYPTLYEQIYGKKPVRKNIEKIVQIVEEEKKLEEEMNQAVEIKEIKSLKINPLE